MRVTVHAVTVSNQKVTANYVPAAAVIRRSDVKAFGLTEEVHRKPGDLSAEEDSGTPCVAVECVDIWKNTSGEGGCLVCN